MGKEYSSPCGNTTASDGGNTTASDESFDSDLSTTDESCGGLLLGDIVAAASDTTGQLGEVENVSISVDLLTASGSIIEDVSCKYLKRLRDYIVGDYVAHGPWLGRVGVVVDTVTILFDDGSMCKVVNADPLRLKPVSKSFLPKDGHFSYYPGQLVRESSSSVFKNAKWLSGSWNERYKEGTVADITIGSLFVHWIVSAGFGPEPDSATPPTADQIPENLIFLNLLPQTSWKVGHWCFHISQAVPSDPPPCDCVERAHMIVSMKTTVDVVWQDGNREFGIVSTALVRNDYPGEHDFLAEQYVVEKSAEDCNIRAERRFGVIKSVNAKERITCVKWFNSVYKPENRWDFDNEEMVSVYELEAHRDYDYCYGDVVVRLIPVSEESSIDLDEENDEQVDSDEAVSANNSNVDFSVLSWVGYISGLLDGNIQVTWADGNVSWVWPQEIYVVGVDDDEESVVGERETSCDDAGSWNTLHEDETNVVENAIEVWPQAISVVGCVGDEESNGAKGEIRYDNAASFEILNEHETEPIMNVEEESQSRNRINIIDAEVSTENSEDINSVRNGLLSIPLAALGFTNSCIFKHFDTAKDHSDHFFLGANVQSNCGRKWLKKVQQDWNILEKDLPDGIYVRVYEDRMDLLRAAIVGACGTPYQDGVFVFDFHLPPEYPQVPPSVHYHSGGWQINPNLYKEGKVCLSLLNTWTGKGTELWDPSSSTLLQILLSLQGLVLNTNPYFNEAGYDKLVGTTEGEKNALSYNENTFLLNCKLTMYLLRMPPKDFQELIKDHFRRRGKYIIKACDAYMKGYLIGTLREDASSSDESHEKSTSLGFRLMLAKIMPDLVTALKDVGAEVDELMHIVKLASLKC